MGSLSKALLSNVTSHFASNSEYCGSLAGEWHVCWWRDDYCDEMTPTIPQSPRPASAGVEVRPAEAASARGRSGPAGEVSVSVVSSRLVNTLNKHTRKSSKTNCFFKVYAHLLRTFRYADTSKLGWYDVIMMRVEPFNIKIIQTSPLFTIHSLLGWRRNYMLFAGSLISSVGGTVSV